MTDICNQYLSGNNAVKRETRHAHDIMTEYDANKITLVCVKHLQSHSLHNL